MQLQPLKKPKNLVPLIILLIFIFILIINIHPTCIVPAGRTLYEKTDYGYRPIYNTRRTTEARITKRKGNYIKVNLDYPDASLWVPVLNVYAISGLFGRFFVDAYSGKINRRHSPFKTAIITRTYNIKRGRRIIAVTERYESIFFLFSLFILATAALAMKRQVIKNTLIVIIFSFMFIYCIYASVLVSSRL